MDLLECRSIMPDGGRGGDHALMSIAIVVRRNAVFAMKASSLRSHCEVLAQFLVNAGRVSPGFKSVGRGFESRQTQHLFQKTIDPCNLFRQRYFMQIIILFRKISSSVTEFFSFFWIF